MKELTDQELNNVSGGTAFATGNDVQFTITVKTVTIRWRGNYGVVKKDGTIDKYGIYECGGYWYPCYHVKVDGSSGHSGWYDESVLKSNSNNMHTLGVDLKAKEVNDPFYFNYKPMYNSTRF